MLEPDQIREWARRPWEKVALARASWWREQYAKAGAQASVRASDVLRRHVARFAPTALTYERAADHLHHVELRRRFDAINARFRR